MAEVDLTRPAATTNGESQRGEAQGSTVIANQDSIQGRLTLHAHGEILGRFEGHVDSDGELLVGKDAEVDATIVGVNVTVAGMVRGNITARGRLKITASGRLDGDATVGRLVVQEGGVHHGRIMVHPEGLPEPMAGSGPAGVSRGFPEERRPDFALSVKEEGGTPDQKPAASPVEVVKKLWGEFF